MADISLTMDLQLQQIATQLQQVDSKLDSFAGRAASHGKKAAGGFSGAFSGLGSAAGGLLGGLGIGLGVGAIVGKFEDVIRKGSQINDLASRFGITAEQLQLIGNAAAQDGVPLEQVAAALNKLEVGAGKGGTAAKNLDATLHRLGINAETYRKADPSEKFLQLTDTLKGAAVGSQRYADIAGLIGIRNTQMIATMKLGREEITKLSTSMGILSNESTKRLDAAGDAINKFNNRITVGFGGSLTWLDKFNTKMEGIADKTRSVLVKIGLGKENKSFVGGGGSFGGKGAGSDFGAENKAPDEGSGYGGDIATAVEGKVGDSNYQKESELTPEQQARRRRLLNIKSSLEDKGLTLGTASANDIDIEMGRAFQKEEGEDRAAANAKVFEDMAKTRDKAFHPGQDLADELDNLGEDSGDDLEEQNEILSEIRDNTADYGANQ